MATRPTHDGVAHAMVTFIMAIAIYSIFMLGQSPDKILEMAVASIAVSVIVLMGAVSFHQHYNMLAFEYFAFFGGVAGLILGTFSVVLGIKAIHGGAGLAMLVLLTIMGGVGCNSIRVSSSRSQQRAEKIRLDAMNEAQEAKNLEASEWI